MPYSKPCDSDPIAVPTATALIREVEELAGSYPWMLGIIPAPLSLREKESITVLISTIVVPDRLRSAYWPGRGQGRGPSSASRRPQSHPLTTIVRCICREPDVSPASKGRTTRVDHHHFTARKT